MGRAPPCRRQLSLASYPWHHAVKLSPAEGRMRMHAALISILAAGAAAALAVAGLTGGLAAPSAVALLADKSPNAIPVDVELVVAVDVSYSMDPEEQSL